MLKQTTFPEYFEPEHFTKDNDAVLTAKVSALLAAMTEDEKLNLCHGGDNPPEQGQIANAGYLAGVPRLGVPEIRMYDGPAGVTSVYETTGLPVQEMLASSWDTSLAYDYGKVEGSENFAISGNTQLGSQFDLVRTPHFGRNPDMLGEDPFLTSALAVEETKGIQDSHAVATLKHFFAASISTNMQEAANQVVDEQTLHELYFPPFKAAALEAGAGAFMSCYNKINGSYASANEYAQKEVMRDMWNYKGYTMTDWGGNHALTTAKGTDIEMPRGTYNSSDRIRKAISKGRLTWDDVDTAAGHVLYGMGMVGYLGLVRLDEDGQAMEESGRTQPIKMKDRYTESVRAGLLDDNAEICLNIARKGAVLLKNEGETLPLRRGESVAMLGLGGSTLFSGNGQERSYGRISRMVAPGKELRDLAPDMDLTVEAGYDFFGVAVPGEYLWQDKELTLPGVTRTWGVSPEHEPKSAFPFDIGGMGKELKGNASSDEDDDDDVPAFVPQWSNSLAADVPGHETGSLYGIDRDINFVTGTQTYKNGSQGTALSYGDVFTWQGYLSVPETGKYTLLLEAIGGNTAMTIALDGENYVSIGSTELREGAQWPWGSMVCTPEGMEVHGGGAYLEAGKAYPIRLVANATERKKDLQVRFAWVTPEAQKSAHERAIKAAERADKVVFFLHGDYAHKDLGVPMFFSFSMGGASSLKAPEYQVELLKEIRSAMKPDAKLAVITNYGQIFVMDNWEPQADAIMNVWTPGQEGGKAIAELLVGVTVPSGKTAITYPQKDEDTLVTDSQEHALRRDKGYRNAEGVSTIDFDEGIFTGYRWYDKENIQPLYPFGHGLSYSSFEYSDLDVSGQEVSFTVKNVGSVAATEIAQVYLGKGQVPQHIQMAEKQLCGFARLENMAPGEARKVSITVPDSSFCYWDPQLELIAREDGTKDKWVRTQGKRQLLVGASSADIRLTGEIE